MFYANNDRHTHDPFRGQNYHASTPSIRLKFRNCQHSLTVHGYIILKIKF